MGISLAGLLVSVGLLLAGCLLRAPLIGALFAAFPFGSTAIVSLGGSSPQVFVVFALAVLAGASLSKGFVNDLAGVLANVRAAPLVCALAVYAIASAMLLPRLFAGTTSALVIVEGAVVEMPLAPVPGNITQTAYFVLGCLMFLVFCVLLLQRNRWRALTVGFFVFATVHALLGLIDIGAKLAGAGDVLAPLRTASYALLVEVIEGGFWRIVGAYPEASTFAGYTLPGLAFSFTYWRLTRSRYALGLTLVLLSLLVFSTSSTAYASLMVIGTLLGASTGVAFLRGRLGITDVQLFAMLWIAVAIGLCVYLYDDRIFEPFLALIDGMVFNKSASMSGQERAYWNASGVAAFLDSYGFGIGMGSSRTSSWAISVLSQLGVAGAAMVVLLLVELVRGFGDTPSRLEDREIAILGRCARTAGVAWLTGSSIAGGSADPGLLFFICLATVVSCRERLKRDSAVRAKGGVLHPAH